jgi:GxxExxY protein
LVLQLRCIAIGGPGLIESIYEKSLAVELEKRAIPFKRQLKLELNYKGVVLDEDFRLDLIIADKVVVEFKVVKEPIWPTTPSPEKE